MSILNEIEIKKKEIFSKSSQLELWFYNFLSSNKQFDFELAHGADNTEKIAFKFFSGSDINVDKELIAVRKSNPNFEFHYSENLILLSAMALSDFDFEKENINKFISVASTTECLILSKTLEGLDFQEGKNKGHIDELIIQTFINQNTNNLPSRILSALNIAHNLVDIFAIEHCYHHLIDIHPVTNQNEKIRLLSGVVQKHHETIELQIKRRLFFALSIILITLCSFTAYILPTYWDELNLEPYVTSILISWGVLLFGLTLYFFLFHKMDGKSFLSNFIRKRLTKRLSTIGIDYDNVNSIIKEFQGN